MLATRSPHTFTLDFMTGASLSRLIALLVVALFAWCPTYTIASDGPKGSLEGGISTVVRSYISAEEKQDYARVYLSLSHGMKERLRRENVVKSANDYRKLRQSSEARWYDFVETKRNVKAETATVLLNVTIEESGEKERVPVTVRLVMQDGHWRIDAIEY